MTANKVPLSPQLRAQMVLQCARAATCDGDLFAMRCLQLNTHEDIALAITAAHHGQGWGSG